VRGLYVYDSQGDDELSVVEGGIIGLTTGGEDYADGWFQGVDSHGKIVRFPYTQSFPYPLPHDPITYLRSRVFSPVIMSVALPA
jgi:hypothetical protein